MGKRIVVLGGGIGGLVVANHLRKGLTRDNEVILVDKERDHLFNPSLLWLMVGWRDKEEIKRALNLLEKKGIRFINADVTKIELEKKKDYLVIPEILYRVSDQFSVTIGANIFGGKRKTTFFGQFDKDDNVYINVRFDF